ncbi:MAG: DUF805 domain-containing protein [Anaerolineae bacterium]
MQWYFKVFRHYFDFKGRASRAEYWWFWFINMIVGSIFAIPLQIAVINEDESQMLLFMVPAALYGLITIIPRLSVMARRLHDTGRSAFSAAWIFLPVIGSFIVLYFLLQRSEERTNHWGRDPRIVDYKPQVSY